MTKSQIFLRIKNESPRISGLLVCLKILNKNSENIGLKVSWVVIEVCYTLVSVDKKYNHY